MTAHDPTLSGASAPNAIAPNPLKAARSLVKGDVPSGLLDRYLIERDRFGRPDRFYRDHRAADPMFRDHGRRLETGQGYPDTIADMLKIAQHRGWAGIKVKGDPSFRREVWVQARSLGIEVTGYRPRDRDRQAAGDRSLSGKDREQASDLKTTLERKLNDAGVVVRRLIPDPAVQARLLADVYARVRRLDPERDAAAARRVREPDRSRR